MKLPEPVDVKVTVKDAVPAEADAVAVLMGKGATPAGLPDHVGAAVAALAEAGVVTGKAGEAVLHLLAGERPGRLLVVGTGDGKGSATDAARNAGGTLAKAAKQHKLKSVAVLVGEADAAAMANGFVLGRFSFDEFKGKATDKADRAGGIRVTIVGDVDRDEVDRAVVLAEAQNFARSIASRPGNVINPPSLAKVAEDMAKAVGLDCTVMDEDELEKRGMGGILAVGAGSTETPPRLIVLEHGKPKRKGGKKRGGAPLLVVGKAITFDTGGISIKPAAGMQGMVFDKCGGMAVLGLMYALAKLKVDAHVVGILAAAENHISGSAYRPGDILTMYNGVTVEVTNTDAEGRLVLGDALAYGVEQYAPAAVVDLATLTGSCVVALGTTIAGLMSNSDELVEQLRAASVEAGEQVWRMPVYPEHKEKLKSVPADIVNAPGREGGSLTAAAFLMHFVPSDGSVPYAHLDIAGVADTDKPTPLYGKGATGWGVRTLFAWVTGRGESAALGGDADQDTPPPAGG